MTEHIYKKIYKKKKKKSQSINSPKTTNTNKAKHTINAPTVTATNTDRCSAHVPNPPLPINITCHPLRSLTWSVSV